jgi:hypothetical protein
MQTARMLEAECVQVLRESLGTGTQEDESSTGRVWAAGFHHVMACSCLARFEIYELFISLIFQLLFLGHCRLQILNQRIWGNNCICNFLYIKNLHRWNTHMYVDIFRCSQHISFLIIYYLAMSFDLEYI